MYARLIGFFIKLTPSALCCILNPKLTREVAEGPLTIP